MAKPKCGYCNRAVAKRYCPSLDKLICPLCCGSNRLKNISCDKDCRYLDNEMYQQRIREEKELKALLEDVPHSQHDDIFKDPDAANIAYAFESFFADCYVKGVLNLTDQKVKETLINLYHLKVKGRSLEPDDTCTECLEKQQQIDALLEEGQRLREKLSDDFTSLTLHVYDHLKDNNADEELMGTVILRLIISINNMTGGTLGSYGYLNYLKNNLHPNTSGDSDGCIIETKDGKKTIVPKSKLRPSGKVLR